VPRPPSHRPCFSAIAFRFDLIKYVDTTSNHLDGVGVDSDPYRASDSAEWAAGVSSVHWGLCPTPGWLSRPPKILRVPCDPVRMAKSRIWRQIVSLEYLRIAMHSDRFAALRSFPVERGLGNLLDPRRSPRRVAAMMTCVPVWFTGRLFVTGLRSTLVSHKIEC
jgi:hypothetical protein